MYAALLMASLTCGQPCNTNFSAWVKYPEGLRYVPVVNGIIPDIYHYQRLPDGSSLGSYDYSRGVRYQPPVLVETREIKKDLELELLRARIDFLERKLESNSKKASPLPPAPDDMKKPSDVK